MSEEELKQKIGSIIAEHGKRTAKNYKSGGGWVCCRECPKQVMQLVKAYHHSQLAQVRERVEQMPGMQLGVTYGLDELIVKSDTLALLEEEGKA